MSVQIKTEDGWVKAAGNINPQLIADVNQRIDGLQSEIDAIPTEYTITPSGNVTSLSYFKLLVKGKFAQLIADVTYTTNATAYAVDLLGTLPSNIKPFGTTNLNFIGTYNLTDTALKSIIINPNNKTISAQCGQTNQSKRLFINLTFLIE